IAMNSMQFNLARVIGPVLAGLALTMWDAAIFCGVNGLSLLSVIVALLMIHIPPARTTTGEQTSMVEDMKEGFRFVASKRSLLLLTFLAFAGTFLGMPIVTFLPVVAKSTFGLDARGYSWLLTAYGLGSVAGALLVAASGHIPRKGRLAIMLQLAFAVCLVAFAFSRVLALSTVIAFFAGACIVGVISMYSS